MDVIDRMVSVLHPSGYPPSRGFKRRTGDGYDIVGSNTFEDLKIDHVNLRILDAGEFSVIEI